MAWRQPYGQQPCSQPERSRWRDGAAQHAAGSSISVICRQPGGRPPPPPTYKLHTSGLPVLVGPRESLLRCEVSRLVWWVLLGQCASRAVPPRSFRCEPSWPTHQTRDESRRRRRPNKQQTNIEAAPLQGPPHSPSPSLVCPAAHRDPPPTPGTARPQSPATPTPLFPAMVGHQPCCMM